MILQKKLRRLFLSTLKQIDKKCKEFRDAVHGYISIPDILCDKFINTEIFQRLRHIEQTSMRVLYPSAHHDRFAHSLGVFHLGNLVFQKLYNNSPSITSKFKHKDWESYYVTFVIACLMHDCGHAPFSHTFEDLYDKNELSKQLTNMHCKKDPEFSKDLEEVTPAEHEIASSYILLKKYSNDVIEMKGNPLLASRMIIGCKHETINDDKSKFENCLIMLLNSEAIDVDKLDYIVRDTWASGVNNVSIDLLRLISSIEIYEDNTTKKYAVAFKKNSLSVLQNVIHGRNFLYKWIYSHHKVIYDQHLLKMSINSLGAILSQENETQLTDLISVNSLLEIKEGKRFNFYLPSDGDLLYLLKIYQKQIPKANEWLSRQHSKKPLWKTHAEFCEHFQGTTNDDLGRIFKTLKRDINKDVGLRKLKYAYEVLEVNPKNLVVEKNQLKIEVLTGIYKSYTSIFEEEHKPKESDIKVKIDDEQKIFKFFYVYVENIEDSQKNDIIKIIKEI